MSIQAEMSELKGLRMELKSLNIRAKTIRKRIKQIEEIVSYYIEEKNLPGIKHKGVAVIVQKKIKRKNKSNKQKDVDAMAILSEYGVKNPERVLQKVMEARRGDAEEISKLNIKRIK